MSEQNKDPWTLSPLNANVDVPASQPGTVPEIDSPPEDAKQAGVTKPTPPLFTFVDPRFDRPSRFGFWRINDQVLDLSNPLQNPNTGVQISDEQLEILSDFLERNLQALGTERSRRGARRKPLIDVAVEVYLSKLSELPPHLPTTECQKLAWAAVWATPLVAAYLKRHGFAKKKNIRDACRQRLSRQEKEEHATN